MPGKLVRPFKGFHYHPHQKEAIRWMIQREAEDAEYVRGGILADEMGLGKTWMTIGLLLNNPVANTLLLVPPVLAPQWCEALAESRISYSVLRPPCAKGKGATFERTDGTVPDIHVTVATYDRAANNVAVLVADTTFDRMICDEGHVFRNGKKSRRFTRLDAIRTTSRWILTGTPVQNRKQDFRNLCAFLGVPVEVRIKGNDAKLASALLLRRTVEDVRAVVRSMPTKKPLHSIHAVSMPRGGEEASVFSALVGRFEHAIEIQARAVVILELYLRIRQFLAHPAIYVEGMKRKYAGTYKRESWDGTASKADAFGAFLEATPLEPTIVFGTFRDELDVAAESLRRAGYKVWMIRGGMSDERRGAVTAESRAAVAEGDPVAVVIQIVAGGAGLNLQHCRRIVFLSSHWNPAVVDQAIARAYRMGQTEQVTVHHLLLADDVEKNLDRHMATLHGKKRAEALEIHPKLFCDTAVDAGVLLGVLDAAAVGDEEEAGAVGDDPADTL
jgi:SNF2 family DNA or RNA helicase